MGAAAPIPRLAPVTRTTLPSSGRLFNGPGIVYGPGRLDCDGVFGGTLFVFRSIVFERQKLHFHIGRAVAVQYPLYSARLAVKRLKRPTGQLAQFLAGKVL